MPVIFNNDVGVRFKLGENLFTRRNRFIMDPLSARLVNNIMSYWIIRFNSSAMPCAVSVNLPILHPQKKESLINLISVGAMIYLII